MYYKINLKHTVRSKGERLALWARIWTLSKSWGRLCSSVPSLSLCHISLPHWWFGYRARVEVQAKGPADGKALAENTHLLDLQRYRDKYTRPLAVTCQLAYWTALESWPGAGRRHMEPEWVSLTCGWIMASWLLFACVYFVYPEHLGLMHTVISLIFGAQVFHDYFMPHKY